ncbi:MAG: peptidase [Mycobacterium sp.]
MRILLRLIAVLVSIVLLSTGCTKYLTAKPQSVSNDPNQIAGMPVKDGPSGLRSGAPAPTQDVVNTDDGEIDRLAATAVGDIQEFWSGAYGPPLPGQFTPVDGLFSWDANELNPDVVFCGEQTMEEVNAAWCGEPADNCSSAGRCSSSENTIGWDRGVLFAQERRAFGDMAIPLVLSHEYGHAIQFTSGRLVLHGGLVAEQQADCFAGVYLRWVAEGNSPSFQLSTGDGLNKMLAALLGIRDPVATSEDVLNEHGSAFERVSSFQAGFTEGTSACVGIDDKEILQRRGDLPVTLQEGESGDIPVSEESLTNLVDVLNAVFHPVQPPKLSFDRQLCPGADSSAPASYCPSTNTISADVRALQKMSRSFSQTVGFGSQTLPQYGDYTAYSALVSRYMLAIAQQKGLLLDNANAALRTACLTGVATAKLSKEVTLPSGDTIGLTAGDLDEAVAGLLTNGIVASDVNGQTVPSGFSRVDAFRTGVLGNEDRCIGRFS